jgi:streptogramin lyase
LLKYRVSDWSFVATVNLTDETTNMLQAACCRTDGVSIFVSSSYTDLHAPGTGSLALVRVDIATFAVADSTQLPSNTNAAFTDDMAITCNQIWCGSEASGNCVRFDKSNLSSQTVISTGVSHSCYCVYNDGRYIWMGFNAVSTLARIEPFSLSLDLFHFPAGQEGPNEIWKDELKGHMYFSYWQSDGAAVAKVSSASLAVLRTP